MHLILRLGICNKLYDYHHLVDVNIDTFAVWIRTNFKRVKKDVLQYTYLSGTHPLTYKLLGYHTLHLGCFNVTLWRINFLFNFLVIEKCKKFGVIFQEKRLER